MSKYRAAHYIFRDFCNFSHIGFIYNVQTIRMYHNVTGPDYFLDSLYMTQRMLKVGISVTLMIH